jgi:hypothetical protein
MGEFNRRAFLGTSAGVAAGAAAAVTPGLASADPAAAAEVVEAGSPASKDAVFAYVSNPERAEVTVAWGLNEVTYRDRSLAKRLNAATKKGGR